MHTPEADPILKVTIVPRGRALGVMQSAPVDDRHNYSKEYLMARLMVALAADAARRRSPSTRSPAARKTICDRRRTSRV
ncbi:MAG: hypothetical protein U0528_06015 [Anaerolineae bacterium]